jgi:hypothetical protein
MNFRTAILATTLLTTASFATAQDAGDVSVGLGLTNFGLSLEGEYAISPQASVRAMIMGGINLEGEFDVDEGTVDGETNLGGFAVLGDYYPLANAWRVSGGMFISNTDISGTVSSGGETFDGSIELANSVAPMLTTGFSAEIADGWAFTGDIGVIFSSLEASGEGLSPAEQAEIDDINAALEDVPVVPFLGLAVSYSY